MNLETFLIPFVKRAKHNIGIKVRLESIKRNTPYP